MAGALLPAMLLGLGAVAVWLHLRFPSRRPVSLVRAALHVALSFLAFALLPDALALVLAQVGPSPLRPYLVLALLIPAITYFLLSWIWLLARLIDLLGGPRGGHPVRGGAH